MQLKLSDNQPFINFFRFQSRVHIRREHFFFTRFVFGIILTTLSAKGIWKKEATEVLRSFHNNAKIELVGQCRDGVFLSVKYAVEILKKKEVLISPYTLFQVVNMIILAGGKPVFVDVKRGTLEIDINSLETKKNDQTGCVILTHLSHIPKKIMNIKRFAKENKILLVEDCAVAFGRKDAGKYGDVALLSFQAMKNVQSVVGGAIICNDKKFHKWVASQIDDLLTLSLWFLFKKLMFIKLVSFLTSTPVINYIFFQFLKIGYKNNISFLLSLIRADHQPKVFKKVPENYLKKMTNIQAKFVAEGLKNLERGQRASAALVEVYFQNLKLIKEIKVLGQNNSQPSDYLELPILCERRDELFNYLLKNNVDVRRFYYRNLASIQAYKVFGDNCHNCELMEKSILTLPCYPGFTSKNVKKITENIKTFYSNNT